MPSTLYVITPFKDNSILGLRNSVKSLANQNHLNIKHILIVDESCFEKTENFFKSIELNFNEYSFIIKKSISKGIYSSINQGLDLINDLDPYLVLGAGDILRLDSNINLNTSHQIYKLPYCLSAYKKELIFKFRRNFTGMPYCHNALIFRKNKIRYNQFYSLSADYDYYLRYKKNLLTPKENSNNNEYMQNINSGFVIYESQKGISSKKKFTVHKQNLLIIFKRFSIIGLTIYLVFFLLKIISLSFTYLQRL
jgi:hypothetical protein